MTRLSLFMKLSALILIFSFFFNAKQTTNVIFGEDDRKDIEKNSSGKIIEEFAQSIAIIVNTEIIKRTSSRNYKKVLFKKFKEQLDFCSEEPFINQPAPGWCSAFLVSNNVVATAGHCLTDENSCENMAFIFEYTVQQASKNSYIPSENIFRCKKIIKKEYSPFSSIDFALLELDKKIETRNPLKLNTDSPTSQNAEVFTLGHPNGLPLKIADNAYIINNSDPIFFTANLDTFRGNSGSPVFNKSTGKVEGMLVRGNQDFILDNGCYRSKICSVEECKGEEVIRSTIFSKFIPQSS